MGMSFISVDSSAKKADIARPTGNPNPHKFRIQSSEKIGDFWLVVVIYPDCTNYEGCKLLVMNVDPKTLAVIDPHFTHQGYIVARFQPTALGKIHAKAFLKALSRI